MMMCLDGFIYVLCDEQLVGSWNLETHVFQFGETFLNGVFTDSFPSVSSFWPSDHLDIGFSRIVLKLFSLFFAIFHRLVCSIYFLWDFSQNFLQVFPWVCHLYYNVVNFQEFFSYSLNVSFLNTVSCSCFIVEISFLIFLIIIIVFFLFST